MKQHCFLINNRFYEQLEGTTMGNSLSPFPTNLFMGRFENEPSSEFQDLSRIWLWYVDDIFAIFNIKKTKVQRIKVFNIKGARKKIINNFHFQMC